MDTYDEIYLKCSSMYINIRMSKSNITVSPDGNQLHVIDSSYEINKLVHFTIHCWLMPSTLRSWNSQTLWHTCRDDLSRLRRSWPLARLCMSISRCVRSYAVHVMCRTFDQYATPRCVARSVRLYYTQCHRRRSLPRHQLFIDCQGCPIHTSSVQLHIIIHVVQLKLHSYNYNHDNVIRSVTHNIIPVIS